MNEARDIAITALDAFRDEITGRFIDLCHGNDFNKLTLEKIYDTIDEIYNEHIEKWLDVGTVDSAPVPKWISVKERLPENRGQYIIYMRGQEPFVSWFDGDIFRSPSTVPIECPATHWMPLPEPPKEEGEPK